MDNSEHIFYENRPNLDDRQAELLNCYYQARRETDNDKKVKSDLLEHVLQSASYETDIAVHVLQKVDDEYLVLCAEAVKRAQKNGR